jgi:hypothetical protein
MPFRLGRIDLQQVRFSKHARASVRYDPPVTPHQVGGSRLSMACDRTTQQSLSIIVFTDEQAGDAWGHGYVEGHGQPEQIWRERAFECLGNCPFRLLRFCKDSEVVPGLVELEVAVPRPMPSLR